MPELRTGAGRERERLMSENRPLTPEEEETEFKRQCPAIYDSETTGKTNQIYYLLSCLWWVSEQYFGVRRETGLSPQTIWKGTGPLDIKDILFSSSHLLLKEERARLEGQLKEQTEICSGLQDRLATIEGELV